MRIYRHVHLHEERVRACKTAGLAGLPLLCELDLRSVKREDTVFILGSGWSINGISDSRWAVIERNDTIGFNFWPAHNFVPKIFVFESIPYSDHPVAYRAFRALIQTRSAAYSHVVKVVTDLRPGLQEHQLVPDLPEVFRKNLYIGYTMPVIARNESELANGLKYMQRLGAFTPSERVSWLFKYGGSVIAMLSLATKMNYRRIVLCGIDLGKQDYFYHCRERYPDYADWEFTPRADPHLTTRRLPWMVPAQEVVYLFKKLVLDPAGIELFVENPSSTLYPGVPQVPRSFFEG
jgi:hypothetical protein